MLKNKTCLLLGAGASKHLGFPLGFELKQQILEEIEQLESQRFKIHPPEFFKLFDISSEELNKFYKGLLYSNYFSPDAFLEHNPQYNAIGKYLICKILVEFEKEKDFIRKAGWYENLRSAIHVDSPEKLKDNNLAIVTFNYDRSLDFWLHQYIENQFKLDADEAWKVLEKSIPIVHVHGMLGKYPKSSYGDKNNIYKRSQAIKIVSEADSQKKEFAKASRLLKKSERVVVFGFGFAAENVNRLNYFDNVDLDKTEITIAMGNPRGKVADQRDMKRLYNINQLSTKAACYKIDANRIFDRVVDPFPTVD